MFCTIAATQDGQAPSITVATGVPGISIINGTGPFSLEKGVGSGSLLLLPCVQVGGIHWKLRLVSKRLESQDMYRFFIQ